LLGGATPAAILCESPALHAAAHAAFASHSLLCRYLPVAQNGFVNLPSQLKIDAGYYGSGFYFTRYPRWGRCFILVREAV
jgi:hypothetical protein